MVLEEHLLGVAPESLDAVDVNFSFGKAFVVIQALVPVTMVDQGIIGSELIHVDDGCVVNSLDRKPHQSLGFEVGKNVY